MRTTRRKFSAASFRRRLAADICDGTLWAGIAVLLAQIPSLGLEPLPNTGYGLLDDLAAFLHFHHVSLYPLAAASLVGGILFTATSRAVLGASVGEKLWDLELVTRSGQPIGFQRSALHSLTMLASLAPCLLGYLWAIADPSRQTWANYLSSTRLVRTHDY